MKSRTFVAAVLCAAALGWVAAKGFSDGEPDAEAMKKMMEMAQPGPEHELMKKCEGNWAAHGKFWMGPAPSESDFTATMTMVLGGRFLRQDARGDMEGESFEGLGYTGFDRVGGKFFNVWMDNMGTGAMVGTGSCSADKKTITFTGEGDWGMGPMTWREVLTLQSDNEHLFEMFQTPKGGAEKKVMELQYKRK